MAVARLNCYPLSQRPEQNCPACNLSLSEGTPPVAHPQGGANHPYHLSCLKDRVKQIGACPTCQLQLNLTSLLSRTERLWHIAQQTKQLLITYMSHAFAAGVGAPALGTIIISMVGFYAMVAAAIFNSFEITPSTAALVTAVVKISIIQAASFGLIKNLAQVSRPLTLFYTIGLTKIFLPAQISLAPRLIVHLAATAVGLNSSWMVPDLARLRLNMHWKAIELGMGCAALSCVLRNPMTLQRTIVQMTLVAGAIGGAGGVLFETIAPR